MVSKEGRFSRSVISDSRDAVDCSPPGSSVHGILQARILEWVVIPCSSRSSQSRDRTQIFCTAGRLYQLSQQGSHSYSCLQNLYIPPVGSPVVCNGCHSAVCKKSLKDSTSSLLCLQGMVSCPVRLEFSK